MRKFLIGFVLFWLWINPVQAQGEFHTKYVVNYEFDALGQSKVNQQISLTNLQTNVYAANYQFILPGNFQSQISGHDAKGPLAITTEARGSDTLVSVNFNDSVVGKGNTQTFELDYSGPSAKHNGQIWEIMLPGIGASDFIDEYQLSLKVDPALGKLALISPSPIATQDNSYIFTKDQLAKIGVIAAFGNFQTFGFNLKYQLENKQDRPVYSEIAIPADTNYQRVFYDSLEPKPQNVRVDEDGNWLARYDLNPGQQMQVEAKGQAHLLAEPIRLFPDQVQPPKLSNYLVSTKFWPSGDSQIQLLASTLRTPEAIYTYVANTLHYDSSSQVGPRLRKGGKLALNYPTQAVCLEFSDLFITLARAAGIPAREVDGYAYAADTSSHPLSLESDILHAWPQYWDPDRQVWVNVDPTWASTTGGVDYFHHFDFNHFAFVVHGVNDSQPLSAGLYKTGTSGKNVEVGFTNYQDYPVSNLEFSWQAPWQILPLQNTQSQLNVINTQGQARYHVDVDITPRNFSLGSEVLTHVLTLPPYASAQIPLVLKKGQYLNFSPQSFTVRVGKQAMTYNIGSQLYLAWHISVGLIASLIIVGLAAIAVRAGSLHLQRSVSGHNLRGQSQKPEK